MSLIKKEIEQLRISFPQIIKGFILFLFSSSGLGVALLLRFLQFSGTIILFVSLIVELIALVLNYLLLKKFFIQKEESKESKQKSQFYE